MAKRRPAPAPGSDAASAGPAGPTPAEAAEAKAKGRRLTRVFWLVLSGLFFAGMAFTIVGMWALTNAWDGEVLLLWLPVAAVCVAGGLFCLLLTMGIVYRADLVRGNLVRRIRLFE